MKEPIKCKLTDFGESRSQLIKTKAVTMIGHRDFSRRTPAFIAPEIMLPEMKNSTQSTSSNEFLNSVNIWALGLSFIS